MTPVKIDDWLRELGMPQYEAAFREHEIDTNILSTLTSEDLKEIGVVAVGHRRRLMNAIAELNDNAAATHHMLTDEELGRARHFSRKVESERRQLTIVFCDLVGSTQLSERLDAEELGEVLIRYRDASTSVIESFDGFVAQYQGDGVLAYFGWPKAHENDPERAVRAALEINQKVCQLGEEQHHSLMCRIGIATGPVVVGDIGGATFFEENQVVGRTPNLAARIQSVTKPGTVAIAQETRTMIGDRFQVTEIGTHTLKGIAKPVTVWRVDGLRDDPHDAVTSANLSDLRMVNRKSEVKRLGTLWQLAKQGKGRTVFLCGEPGIGKSRLVEEMYRHVAKERADVLRYQCSPFHSNDALYPMLNQLRHAARLANGSTGSGDMRLLEPSFAQAGLNVAETSSLLSPLLQIQDAARPRGDVLDAQGRKEKTFQALFALFDGYVRKARVLMIFEDLHWADPTTLEYLERFIDRINDRTVLVLITCRQDIAVRWADGPNCELLNLSRLSTDEVSELISLVAGNGKFPDQVSSLIAERSDGVPLFAEELSKAIIESGLLGYEETETRAAVDHQVIPMTLRDSFIARLDRHAESRETVQTAAAIGREFSSTVLAEVIGEQPGKIETVLGSLVKSNIIIPDPQMPDTFTFKHALMRDAAYETMLRRVRIVTHERIARILETLFWDVTPPHVVADHWALSGHHGAAARCFNEAADLAKLQYANVEAAAYYREALEHLQRVDSGDGPVVDLLPDRVDLLENLSGVLALMHDVDGAASSLREAIELVKDDRPRLARLYRLLGVALQQDRVGSLDALAKAEAALGDIDVEAGTLVLTDWIHIQLARLNVYYWSGYGDAMSALVSTLALHIDKANPEQRAEYFDQLVLRDLRNYRYRPARSTVQNAESYVTAAHQTKNLAIIASAHFILGFVHLHRAALNKAETAMCIGLDAARRSGHRTIELRCVTYLATVFRRRGDIERATELALESLKIATQENMNEYIGLAKANLAWSAWKRGTLDEARLNARTALKEFKKSVIAYPFEWSALLPLIAASRVRADLAGTSALCQPA